MGIAVKSVKEQFLATHGAADFSDVFWDDLLGVERVLQVHHVKVL